MFPLLRSQRNRTFFLHVSIRFQLKERRVSASVTLCKHERKHLETFRKSDFLYISELNVHGNTRYVPESRFCLVSVDVRKHVHMLTVLLGYFPETDFFLVSDDVFRPRVTRFCSRNTIFFLLLAIYRSGSLFLIFLVISGQVNMLSIWSQFDLSRIAKLKNNII